MLALVATVVIWPATLSCEFYKLSNWPDDQAGVEQNFSVGLTYVEDVWTDPDALDYDECPNWGMHPYFSTDDLDGPMVAARGMGILACTVPTIVLAALLFLSSRCTTIKLKDQNTRCVIKVLATCMLLLSALSFLLLVAFASDFCKDARDCEFGYAAICAIVAGFLWIAAFGATVRLHVKEVSVSQPQTENRDERMTEQVEPAIAVAVAGASEIPLVPATVVVLAAPEAHPSPSAPPEEEIKPYLYQ